jgi:putative resolvase
MKLSDWAEKQGISYMTAWRWFRDGKLPVKASQMPTKTILVCENEPTEDSPVVIYARVSSRDQLSDLTRQIERLKQFATARGLRIERVVDEIGSGLNGRRKKLTKLLEEPDVKIILVEHKDRLARFGVEFIEATLRSSGRRLIVVEETEGTADLWQDFTDVVTSMCARIYGKRGSKNRAKKAMEALNEN